MAKRMFHNLDAVIRDLVAAQREDEGAGWERLITFARIIADILDVLDDDDDTGLPDPEGSTGGGGPGQLELPDGSDSAGMAGPHEGHGPVCTPCVREVPGMVDPMVGLARAKQLARQALDSQRLADVPGRADAVVGATVRRADVSPSGRVRGGY